MQLRHLPVTLLVLAVLSLSCDSAEPTETELPLARAELRLVPTGGDQSVIRISASPDFASGNVVVEDTMRLQPDVDYTGRFDVFDTMGRNVTSRLHDNPEEFQVVYSVIDANEVSVDATDVESSYGGNEFGADLPVGIRFSATVGEQAERGLAKLRLQLATFEPRQKNGTTLGPLLFDVQIPLFVDVPIPPIPNEHITRATLTLTKFDGSEIWIAEAVNTFNLNLGAAVVPDNVTVTRCVPIEQDQLDCSPPRFSQPDAFTLMAGEYEANWELTDHDAGLSLTNTIFDSGLRHAFQYSSNLAPELLQITDADSSGNPIGLSFTIDVPTRTIIRGGLTSQLFHFDPARGEPKSGGVSTSPRDLHFRFPMHVVQNGWPEDVGKVVVTFIEGQTGSLSRVTAVGGEFGVYDGFLESLSTEACTVIASVEDCVATDSLELRVEATYVGSIELFDPDGGSTAMDEIKSELIHHLFTYSGYLSEAITYSDTDEDGRPVGFEFVLAVPSSGVTSGESNILLSHYGRISFKESGDLEGENDLQFSFPVALK